MTWDEIVDRHGLSNALRAEVARRSDELFGELTDSERRKCAASEPGDWWHGLDMPGHRGQAVAELLALTCAEWLALPRPGKASRKAQGAPKAPAVHWDVGFAALCDAKGVELATGLTDEWAKVTCPRCAKHRPPEAIVKAQAEARERAEAPRAERAAPDLADASRCDRCDLLAPTDAAGLCTRCAEELAPALAQVNASPVLEVHELAVGPWSVGAPAPRTTSRPSEGSADRTPTPLVGWDPGLLGELVAPTAGAALAPRGLLGPGLEALQRALQGEREEGLRVYLWRAREVWLLRAADAFAGLLDAVFADHLADAGLAGLRPLRPPFRVSLTDSAVENKRGGLLGIAYHPTVSSSLAHEVFISATVDGRDAVRILSILAHELLHVWCKHHQADTGQGGHGGLFRALHDAFGLEGGVNASLPGKPFHWLVGPLVELLGPMPHEALLPLQACVPRKEAQVSRNIKVTCLVPDPEGVEPHPSGLTDAQGAPVVVCGFKASTTARWLTAPAFKGRMCCPKHADVPLFVHWPAPKEAPAVASSPTK